MNTTAPLTSEVFVNDPPPQNNGFLPNGEPKGGSPVASTLIYGCEDAVLTDPAFTAEQAHALGDWVADFLAVPPNHIFHGFVVTLVSNGITVGVGGGNYGVDQGTKRQQMAVFLLRAKYGLCYVPYCAPDFGIEQPQTWDEVMNEAITGISVAKSLVDISLYQYQSDRPNSAFLEF